MIFFSNVQKYHPNHCDLFSFWKNMNRMIVLWKPEYGMKIKVRGYRLYVKRYKFAYFMV